MTDTVRVWGSGEIDSDEIAERGVTMNGLMDAAQSWGCDQLIDTFLEHPIEEVRLAFAVLAECERLRISALGHGWQGDVELLEGIINRATAAARLEAKPDGR